MALAKCCLFLLGLICAVQAHNATTSDTSTSSHSPNTAVAMIVLYAVTGCVSLLFCIIIISGAIRAIHHPDRYGPRARNFDGEWSQSRARGLTRAILDSFPIVKFGTPQEALQTKDIERHPDPGVNMPEMRGGGQPSQNSEGHSSLNPGENGVCPVASPMTDGERIAEILPTPGNSSHPNSESSDVIPAAIGRETCPICIVDFEQGDDLRVLPCNHSFHSSCVDPWLLDLSTACPLCRQDFIALENMISGGSELQDPDSTHRTSRFSRYLRLVGRHRREPGDPRSNRISTYSTQL
ncbi:hypothetical protein C8R44DRAFT_812656 [Mycena epipterygia]|nr:hypothetical protein C8R44DRAFT_812656 [Mycena epipterygia]